MIYDISSSLTKARKHLLDLTTRNRLLSLPKTTRSKSVVVVDELSEEILRMLVWEKRPFTFLPKEEDEETLNADSEGAEDDGLITELGAGLGIPKELQEEEEDLDERGVAARHRDTCLQTAMSEEALQNRLLGISNDARTAIEEQGVNTLYLALGQLKWRDSKGSTPGVDRFAPLILVPVELKRSSAQAQFKLRVLDQEPSDNLSLTEKLKEFGLVSPAFEWADDFSPTEYFEEYQERIATMEDWEILPDAMVLGFFSFAKFIMFRDLEPENWPGANALERHDLIKGLMGDGFRVEEELLTDDQHLDALVSVERLSHVVDADSSQALAIEEVRRGQSLVVQGPPGTGKSQTITNLISTAVLDGKKVLFVAEKLAALQVVSRKLEGIGLGPIALELHSHKANKRSVLDELRKTLELGKPRGERHDRSLAQLQTCRDGLNRHAALLNTKREPFGYAVIDVLGHLSNLQDKVDGIEEIPPLEHAVEWSQEALEERRLMIKDLERDIEQLGRPADHPWYGVQSSQLDRFDIDRVVSDASDVLGLLIEQRAAGKRLADALGVSQPETVGEIGYYFDLARMVGSAPDMDPAAIANSAWTTARARLRELTEVGTEFVKIEAESEGRFAEAAWTTDLSQVRMKIAAHGRSLMRVLNGAYRNAMAEFRAVLKDGVVPKAVDERLEWLDTLAAAKAARKRLDEEENELGNRCFGSLWERSRSDWERLAKLVDWVDEVYAKGHDDGFVAMVAKVSDRAACGALAEELAGGYDRFKEALSALCDTKLNLDVQRAFGVNELSGVALDALEKQLGVWRQENESLSKWMTFQRKVEQAWTLELIPFVNAFESGAIGVENGENVFLFEYYRQLYRQLLEESPELSNFDGNQQDHRVERFRESDLDRINMARYETLLKHHTSMPSTVGAAGAVGVLLGEMRRRRGHMPIRKLIAKAGPAVQAIKPVFMMSPLSVAQFLEPGVVEFDLVVFDEASQVEPVDALGAIARGKQLVVVGDERQLPPTRFFSKLGAADDDEDGEGDGSASAGDIESVLGLAEARGLPRKMLRWHYRSRHESLIAVSNAEFYEHQLFIIPSPVQRNEQVGLAFHHVRGGTFDRGRSQRNRVEAQAVAQAVIDHATHHPQQTLGVAAFSVSQRDAIIDELELLRRHNPQTEKFFMGHPYEPFFVKNPGECTRR